MEKTQCLPQLYYSKYNYNCTTPNIFYVFLFIWHFLCTLSWTFIGSFIFRAWPTVFTTPWNKIFIYFTSLIEPAKFFFLDFKQSQVVIAQWLAQGLATNEVPDSNPGKGGKFYILNKKELLIQIWHDGYSSDMINQRSNEWAKIMQGQKYPKKLISSSTCNCIMCSVLWEMCPLHKNIINKGCEMLYE